MKDVCQTKNNIYIFMEYCNGGTLKDYIDSKKSSPNDSARLSEKETIFIFKELREAFMAMYKKNIIHRDIKP